MSQQVLDDAKVSTYKCRRSVRTEMRLFLCTKQYTQYSLDYAMKNEKVQEHRENARTQNMKRMNNKEKKTKNQSFSNIYLNKKEAQRDASSFC